LQSGDLLYASIAMNPIGGLMIFIPVAVFKLGFPIWLPALVGVPLTYVQVLVVDFGWDQFNRWSWWRRMLESKRSPRMEQLMNSGGAFWPTMVLAPLVGPWLVMAFMRYARVPQRRVALPIFLGMACMGTLITLVCHFAPEVLEQWKNV
jgi:hypothetical protein